eukprot:Partr_v1_DN28409_c0_g1_i2_m41621 putative adenylate cyclase
MEGHLKDSASEPHSIVSAGSIVRSPTNNSDSSGNSVGPTPFISSRISAGDARISNDRSNPDSWYRKMSKSGANGLNRHGLTIDMPAQGADDSATQFNRRRSSSDRAASIIVTITDENDVTTIDRITQLPVSTSSSAFDLKLLAKRKLMGSRRAGFNNTAADQHFRPVNTVLKDKNAAFLDTMQRRKSLLPPTNSGAGLQSREKSKKSGPKLSIFQFFLTWLPDDCELSEDMEQGFELENQPVVLKFWRSASIITVVVIILYWLWNFAIEIAGPLRGEFDYHDHTSSGVNSYLYLLGFAALPPLIALVIDKFCLIRSDWIFYTYTTAYSLLTCLVTTERIFVEYVGPSINICFTYIFLYLSPSPSPRWSSFCAIMMTFVNVAYAYVQFAVRPNAPNFGSHCRRDIQEIGPSCSEHMIASIIFHLLFHTFGYFSMIYNYRHSRRIYLRRRELREEVARFRELSNEAARLALSILPKKVWTDMKVSSRGPSAIDSLLREGKLLYKYKNVSTLFADVVGFTQLCSVVNPQKLVRLLDSVFSEFDDLVDQHGLEKIRTIGDAYMVCAGVPEPVEDGPLKLIHLAQKMIQVMENASEIHELRLMIRIGIHTGSAWGGVLGTEKVMFDVWSRDVTIAALMEHTGAASKIHVSKETMELVSDDCDFEAGKTVEYKDSQISTYFVKQLKRRLSGTLESSNSKSLAEAFTSESRARRESSRNYGFELPKDAFKSKGSIIYSAEATGLEVGKELNKLTLQFEDSTLEEIYNGRFLKAFPAHANLAFLILLVDALGFVIIEALVSKSYWSIGVSLIMFFFMSTIVFTAIHGVKMKSSEDIIASNLSVNKKPYNFAPAREKVSEILHSSVTLVGPGLLLLLALSCVPSLFGPNSTSIRFQYMKILMLQSQTALFPRISFAHHFVVSVVGLLTFYFIVGFSGYFTLLPTEFTMITYSILHLILMTFITRRLESLSRLEFAKGRTIMRQKRITEDVSAKTVDLLDRIVPPDVVQR